MDMLRINALKQCGGQMIKDIIAIDSHTHINHGSKFDSSPEDKFYDASLEYLTKLNFSCNIRTMLCSTFSSVLRTDEVEEENEYLYDLSEKVSHLYQWVVIDPRNKNTFTQADRMLDSKKCVGIKLHPPCHGYTLDEFGEQLCSFANERGAIVQIHPEMSPDYILPFANKYKDATFIMAHMCTHGNGNAKAISNAENGNVYIDTSGIASSKNKGIETVVEKVGSDRILFGTDTYAAGFQRGRIEYALIDEIHKENILRNNALRLFSKKLSI